MEALPELNAYTWLPRIYELHAYAFSALFALSLYF